ncbi:MAG TPA: hypothetical protein VHK47_24670 [Polyangia bacterium]|jgi:Na+-transporting NADH:ubiquinone oxidoreductase subunit NqrB|nr:hypothetical protein [Polyangia bacterium]
MAIAAVAAIAATPSTVIALGTAWDLNPRGAIHSLAADGALQVHWRAWLLVGATRFTPVFVSVCALGAFLRAAIASVRRRRAAAPPR